MSFRAVLFDVDGTLLDTLQDLADSVNAVLTRSGFLPHKVDAYRYFVGDGSTELARRSLPDSVRDVIDLDDIVKAIDEEYTGRWAVNTHPYPGIPGLLSAISQLGLKQCVLSNKKQSFTELTLDRFFPEHHFDIVIGAQPGLPRKPDPTAALQIAGCMNINPGDFMYVGDTATDMKTAVAAGMYPVGVLWGFRDAGELLNSGAQSLAALPADILTSLKNGI
jgi:phosphoglycolate phosphatase